MIKRIIVAVVGLPLVFLILFYFPPIVLSIGISIVCALIVYELLHAVMSFKGNVRLFIYTMISAASIPLGIFFGLSYIVIPIAFLALLSLAFLEAIIRFGTDRHYPISHILLAFFAGLLIPYLISTLVVLRVMPHGRFLVLVPVICAFATDGGAYFVGVLFGKHKAFPQVSPNKTVEGCVGGIVFGTLALMIFGIVINLTSLNFVNFWALLAYGLVGSVICQLGDLAFSLTKREFKIKDFGSFLPGHGGALDRFDSMIFTAPAIYLLVLLLPFFGILVFV